MLKRLNFFVVFSIISCASPGKKELESQWGELKSVGPTSCSPWPLAEKELDVAQMVASSGESGGFIALTRLRNGSVLPMYASTSNDESVSHDDLMEFPIGRNAHVIGLGDWNSQPIAFIAQNKNDRAWIEVRGVRDNKLIARMGTPIAEEVMGGKIVPSSKGWWLQLNHSETDSSFLNVTPNNTSQWKFMLSQFKATTRSAAILSDEGDVSAHVVELLRDEEESKGHFKLTRLSLAGGAKEIGSVSVPTKGGLESWSATSIGGRVAIALVRGDSMVGQAVLVIATVSTSSQQPVLAWTREFSMQDVHLAEPVWVPNGSKALVGLMKWIDGEGALARLKVDASGAEPLPDVGAFDKGTVLVSGYLDAKERGLGAFRYRSNDLWKYKLCKLTL